MLVDSENELTMRLIDNWLVGSANGKEQDRKSVETKSQRAVILARANWSRAGCFFLKIVVWKRMAAIDLIWTKLARKENRRIDWGYRPTKLGKKKEEFYWLSSPGQKNNQSRRIWIFNIFFPSTCITLGFA